MLKFSTEGVPEFNRKIKQVKSEGLFTKKIMGRVAAHGVSVIRQETLAGRDSDGKRFAKYSLGYLKYKNKRGSTKVNLNDKGHMLSAINFKARTNRSVLFFTKTKEAQKAHGHHTGGIGTKRKFFSIRTKRQKELMGIVIKTMRKIIK